MKKYAIWRTRWGMRTMIEGWFSLDGEPVVFDSESCASEYLRRLIQKNYDFNLIPQSSHLKNIQF